MTSPWSPPRQACTASDHEVRDFYRDKSDAPGGGPVRTVSLTLASYYSASRGCAWPTVRTLADSCRIGADTVTRAVRALVEAGEWETVSVPYGKQRRLVYVPTMTVGKWPANPRADRLRAKASEAGKASAAKRANGATVPVDAYGPTVPDSDSTRTVPPLATRTVPPLDRATVGPYVVLKEDLRGTLNCSGGAAAGDFPDPFTPVDAPAAAPVAAPVKAKALKTGAGRKAAPKAAADKPAKADDAHQAAHAAFTAFYDARIKGTGEVVAFVGVVMLLAKQVRNGLDPARLPAVIETAYGYGHGFSATQLSKAKRELDGDKPKTGARTASTVTRRTVAAATDHSAAIDLDSLDLGSNQ